jgi:beta-mannosidase
MRGTIRGVDGHHCELLASGWEFCSAPAEASPEPATLEQSRTAWRPARVPGTVASSLRDLVEWSLAAVPRRFDAEDWWFRCRFSAPASQPGDNLVLGFDGLACLADVWLN